MNQRNQPAFNLHATDANQTISKAFRPFDQQKAKMYRRNLALKIK